MFKCTIQWFLAYSELVVCPSLPSILEHFLPPTKETHTWFKAPSPFLAQGPVIAGERNVTSFIIFPLLFNSPLQIPELGQEGEDQGKRQR